MTTGKLELVSSAICPYVQRSAIVLLEKGVDFDITYVDLSHRPQWLKELTPFGKVPVLRVGDEVLFESAVINEYLDETIPPTLHPSHPLQRAQDRAWIEVGSSILASLYGVMTGDEESFSEHRKELEEKLTKVEAELASRQSPFWNGESFSLVDGAWAPIFSRLEVLGEIGEEILSPFPRTSAWSRSLLSRESVKASTVPDFKDRIHSWLEEEDSWVLKKMS